MSEQGSNGGSRVVAYLTQQLERNPLQQSGEIIGFRARALRIADNQNAAAIDVAQKAGQRKLLAQRLETLRGMCFKAPIEQFNNQLNAIDLANYPDLQALATRLRTIITARSRLPHLSQHRHFDGDFLSALKQVFTSPPRDVAVLREQVLSSFHTPQNRKRGTRMIRLLKQELPELYALERDWLDSLLRYRSTAAREHYITDGYGLVGCLGLLVIVVTIIALAAYVNDKHRTQSRPPGTGLRKYSKPLQPNVDRTPPPVLPDNWNNSQNE